MAKRVNRTTYFRERYRRQRQAFIEQLGGRCVKCGSQEDLQFDHINGRDWEATKKSRWSRLAIIKREAEQGLIQILCGPCNAAKGGRGAVAPASLLPSTAERQFYEREEVNEQCDKD